ncbi:hypothetical protein MY5147_009767, partial [Beauveria neobassiana]
MNLRNTRGSPNTGNVNFNEGTDRECYGEYHAPANTRQVSEKASITPSQDQANGAGLAGLKRPYWEAQVSDAHDFGFEPFSFNALSVTSVIHFRGMMMLEAWGDHSLGYPEPVFSKNLPDGGVTTVDKIDTLHPFTFTDIDHTNDFN